MNKKYLWLLGLAPLFMACTNTNNKVEKTLSTSNLNVINEEQPDEDACTIMYVGKGVSKSGNAIIARSSDAGPGAMCINTTLFSRNELANKTIDSHKGFKYKLPSTTYRYISTPRNPIMNKGHHWEASAINENGVGVSATLSCYTDDSIAKEGGTDPLVPAGIGEDNIAEIVAATSKSAEEGIKTIAKIIDNQGSCETNAFMTVDKKEAWYMEIYSGHQYAAVKMPENKILTAGNEFVFDSLNKMEIAEKDTLISSKLLETVPGDKRLFDDEGTGVRNLRLAESYYNTTFNDVNHMRTWRGYSLFGADKYSDWEEYANNQKYDAFYDPKNNLGISDVKDFMRDRYEDILSDEDNPNHNHFLELDKDNNLRYIGIENAYQIHVIQSDKDLPDEIAATMWLSLCNANYTPFVPINAGVNYLSSAYTHVSTSYSFDEKSAAHIFKKLNSLGFTRRKEYGLPIQRFWEQHESIWEQEYNEILNKTAKAGIATRRDILTNYVNTTQEEAVKAAKFMIDDLTWHMMNDQSSFKKEFTEFKPCVNVKDYARSFGYSYAKNANTVRLKKDKDVITIKLTNTEYRPGDHSTDYRFVGELTHNKKTEEVQLGIADNEFYVPYESMSKYIKGNVVVNINEFKTPENNMMYWIIPVVIGVPIIFGVTISLIRRYKGKE